MSCFYNFLDFEHPKALMQKPLPFTVMSCLYNFLLTPLLLSWFYLFLGTWVCAGTYDRIHPRSRPKSAQIDHSETLSRPACKLTISSFRRRWCKSPCPSPSCACLIGHTKMFKFHIWGRHWGHLDLSSELRFLISLCTSERVSGWRIPENNEF